MITIERFDHLVLTVANIEATVAFYQNVLGMSAQGFGDGRIALHFGKQKINLHQSGKEFEPKAIKPQTGSADLCLITTSELTQAIRHVIKCDVEIIEGPVKRTGALGDITSFYFRDPDGNLIEVATYSGV